MRIPKKTDRAPGSKRGTLRVQGGKGDTYRPVNWERWSENYDKIYGKRKIKTWTPEKQ